MTQEYTKTEENTESRTKGLAYLETCRDAGIKLLRVNPGTKKPCGKEWQKKTAAFESIVKHAREQRAIGWQVGEVSGYICAVDNDCPVTEALAPSFLEDTLKVAKGDHPPSLYIYRSPGLGFELFNDPVNGERILDVKASNNGKGHHIVVPPTEHATKGPYRFVGGFSLARITEIDEHELRAQVGKLVVASMLARNLPESGRHDLAMALAGYMLRHDVDTETVREILHAAWAYRGAPHEAHTDIDGIVRDTAEKLARGEELTGGPTLAECLSPKTPKRIAEALQFQPIREQDSRQKATKSPRGGDSQEEEEEPTHDELRDYWLATHTDYAFGLEDWRRYENGIWPVVKAPVVKESMVRVLEDAKEEGVRPSVFVLNSVHALAQMKAYIPDEVWDNEPDVIVCENECINTRTGDVVPHNREHYATTRIPCVYDANAEAPNWERFLSYLGSVTTVGTVKFLQEFAGYSLTSDTSLEKALWLVGPPGGGKSTFIEGLKAVLGARAGTLGLREIERSRFSLHKIVGKSLVTSTEQPSGFVGCHDILNAIISGEEVQVERKNRDPYDYVPKAKIVWSMNELPRVSGGADGLFRRIEVVRFPKLPAEKVDTNLKEAIKGEAEGILRWAVDGLLCLKMRGGFDIPETVKEDTDEFRSNNDIPAAFLEEACYTGSDRRERSRRLYLAYKSWCKSSGYTPKAINTVKEDWQRLGLKKKKEEEGMIWEGAEVKEEYVAYE